MNKREVANQLMALMAHIVVISEENQFAPPIEVNATDQDRNEWDFEYSPGCDVDLMLASPKLPITLRLRDSKGTLLRRELQTQLYGQSG
jgi:hypothetical protein